MLMDLQRDMQELRKVNTEIKQALEGLQNRVDEMQETINGLENREQQRRELMQREIKGSPGMKEF